MIVHAGLIAQRVRGHWLGVLIEGPSGAGKSDLALRALAHGFRLVADDRVLLWSLEGQLFGRAPDALAGLVEARGVGVVPEPRVDFCEVVLAVAPGPSERVPEPTQVERSGVALPQIKLAYGEASAPAKLGRAMGALYLSRDRRM